MHCVEKCISRKLPFYRQSVLNAQQDFTVLAQLMVILDMCRGLTLRCCVLKDTIAHQVRYNSAVIATHSCLTNIPCYQTNQIKVFVGHM